MVKLFDCLVIVAQCRISDWPQGLQGNGPRKSGRVLCLSVWEGFYGRFESFIFLLLILIRACFGEWCLWLRIMEASMTPY